MRRFGHVSPMMRILKTVGNGATSSARDRSASKEDSPKTKSATARNQKRSAPPKPDESLSPKLRPNTSGTRRRLKDMDAASLEKWKQEEREFVRLKDKEDTRVWFLVSALWLKEWKDFIKRSGSIPGPIDNARLVDPQTGVPHKGLRVVEDYRGVNSDMWGFWLKRYGGGPEVRRSTLDLYAPPLDPSDDVDELQSPTSGNSPQQTQRLPLAFTAPQPMSLQSQAQPLPPLKEAEADKAPRRTGSLVSSGESLADRAMRRSAAAVVDAETSPSRRAGSTEFAATSPAASSEGRAARAATPRGRPAKQAGSESTLSRGARSSKSVPPERAARQERTSKPVCCDKCDGPHETDLCPHFKGVREKHKDAWSMLGKSGKVASVDDVPVITAAKVIRQPGDGSCLFHSLHYGLTGRADGGAKLRREICTFIAKNPDIEIGDNALKDWIHYDGGASVASYAKKMEGGTWGGGIEMAAFAKMKNVNVHVYEACERGYRRISAFESPAAKKTVSVLYQGRAHYDVLVLI